MSPRSAGRFASGKAIRDQVSAAGRLTESLCICAVHYTTCCMHITNTKAQYVWLAHTVVLPEHCPDWCLRRGDINVSLIGNKIVQKRLRTLESSAVCQQNEVSPLSTLANQRVVVMHFFVHVESRSLGPGRFERPNMYSSPQVAGKWEHLRACMLYSVRVHASDIRHG